MVSALNVEMDTGQKINLNALFSYNLNVQEEGKKSKLELEEVQKRVVQAQEGPRRVSFNSKRKVPDDFSYPAFKRGFIWNNKASLIKDPYLSPVVASTLSIELLPSPPSHLMNDLKIITALHTLDRYIDVSTPFNVDKLELLLSSHPNQPFVLSVMQSLREGFWPFDRGEWEDEWEDVIENYVSQDIDVDVIRQY